MSEFAEKLALDHDPSRRKILKIAGGLVLSSVIPASFARAQTSGTIKIGYVSPKTGPLAVFAEPDDFTLAQMKKALAKGISVGGKKYAVEIIYKDSQSDSNRASEVASELILKDKVNLVMASATPATTNPVADQCELNGVPCITNDTPWQPHFFGRGGDPKKGFDWTYHFFWGLEDVIAVYSGMWAKIPTNKSVGSLWPNDSDGNAWGDPKLGFPPVLSQKGFKLTDKGRYQSPADDFSAYITEFKRNNVEIVSGVIPPPDFANFWTQAGQQGFKPKIVTVGKATEFAAAIQGFGARANGLTVEVWWSPAHPFRSSLTGQSSSALAAAYTAATGRPWTMPLGFKHSLFEVAIDSLKRATSLEPGDIRDAVKTTNLQTIVGPINFRTGPVPNISKTPLVGGQWRTSGKGLNLAIVENSQAPNIRLQAAMEAIK
jgi:branched-chain amino acid transport system substrate-binding protein